MKCISSAIKSGTQIAESLLIINMIFEVEDLDPKWKSWADSVWSQTNVNYEYINWNWWPWPNITNLPNFVPKLKINRCSNIYEVRYQHQMEYSSILGGLLQKKKGVKDIGISRGTYWRNSKWNFKGWLRKNHVGFPGVFVLGIKISEGCS